MATPEQARALPPASTSIDLFSKDIPLGTPDPLSHVRAWAKVFPSAQIRFNSNWQTEDYLGRYVFLTSESYPMFQSRYHALLSTNYSLLLDRMVHPDQDFLVNPVKASDILNPPTKPIASFDPVKIAQDGLTPCTDEGTRLMSLRTIVFAKHITVADETFDRHFKRLIDLTNGVIEKINYVTKFPDFPIPDQFWKYHH